MELLDTGRDYNDDLSTKEVFRVLKRGHAPALEELIVNSQGRNAQIDLNTLTRAIYGGKLPRLSSLTLDGPGIESNALARLVNELVRSYQAKFGILHLQRVQPLITGDARSIPADLGLWSGLEGLKMFDVKGGGQIIQTIEKGAHVFPALKSFSISGPGFGVAPFHAFFHALRRGGFPALASLDLRAETAAIGKFMVRDLADALVGFAEAGAPSRLEQLKVGGKGLGIDVVWPELARVLKAGPLPRPVRQDVQCTSPLDPKAAPLHVDADAWVAALAELGPKVTATQLKLKMCMPENLKDAIIAALEAPAFCPRLRHPPALKHHNAPGVEARSKRMAEVWQKRLVKIATATLRPPRAPSATAAAAAAAAAPTAAAGAGATTVEAENRALVARNEQLAARVRELEGLVAREKEG